MRLFLIILLPQLSTGRRVFFFFRIVSNFKMVKTLTLLVHAGLFYVVSIIHRTLTWTTGSLTCVYMIFLHAYTHGGHRFIVSSERTFVESDSGEITGRAGAKPSTWWSCTHPFGDHAWSCLTLASESECSCSVPLTLLYAKTLPSKTPTLERTQKFDVLSMLRLKRKIFGLCIQLWPCWMWKGRSFTWYTSCACWWESSRGRITDWPTQWPDEMCLISLLALLAFLQLGQCACRMIEFGMFCFGCSRA